MVSFHPILFFPGVQVFLACRLHSCSVVFCLWKEGYGLTADASGGFLLTGSRINAVINSNANVWCSVQAFAGAAIRM